MYALKPGLNSIGRMPDNDVVVADPSVSRRHCAIVVHLVRGCELHDTASKNGTFLNGKRIHGPTRLAAGDVIKMCDREITFQSGDAPPPPDSPGHAATIG
jgi:pSer/pThr/pTyr-binding forkhead associated (FHA) protein